MGHPGQLGNRVWVVWTHHCYGNPESASFSSALYILCLVIKIQSALDTFSSDMGELPRDVRQYESQMDHVKAVLQKAQSEAAEWRSSNIKLWKPTPLVLRLIERTQIGHWKEEREDEGMTTL